VVNSVVATSFKTFIFNPLKPKTNQPKS
jgi:hypothetical protein